MQNALCCPFGQTQQYEAMNRHAMFKIGTLYALFSHLGLTF